MLLKANTTYAQELRKVSKEFRHGLKEGNLDSFLIGGIANFCRSLDSVAEMVTSCWQDYTATDNPFHEYNKITDAKEKEIEKKRQKCTKHQKEMEEKLELERRKYEKSFRIYYASLEKLQREKEDEAMVKINRSVINQANSRMDVATSKYQTLNIKESQKREEFKDEMEGLRWEWLENEEKKLACLIRALEDAIVRMTKTAIDVSSDSAPMLNKCVAYFKDVNVEELVETSLKKNEKQYVFHEYKTDDNNMLLKRVVSLSDSASKMDKQESKTLDCTYSNQGSLPKNSFYAAQNSGRSISSCNLNINVNNISPKKNRFFQPEKGRWFEKSP